MFLDNEIENKLLKYIQAEMEQDLAHDIKHVLRVVKMAKLLSRNENAIEHVVIPAAYLHDCFILKKNHPDRSQSSKMAAEKAVQFLKQENYPSEYLDGVYHAIEAHSFSANVKAMTLEAQIVQDADRLDALGAVGIARCIQVSSSLERPLYSESDPFCAHRSPDDKLSTIDHFYTKLFLLEELMNTSSAKKEAKKRTDFMRVYLKQLELEV